MPKLSIKTIERIAKNIDGMHSYLWDSDLKGFGVRVSKTGRITWLVQKSLGSRANRNTVRIALGHYPELSLDDARIKAGQTIVDLANGVDVQAEKPRKKSALQDRLDGVQLRQAIEDYLSERSGARKRSQANNYEPSVRRRLETARDELGPTKRVNQVSKADIRGVLKKRKDAGHHAEARALFAQLRPFFDWCVHEEHIAVSPCVGVVPPAASTERQHKLTDEEIKTVWSACLPYFKVLLLTAQRRTEVASMQWSELNLDKAEWIIPASKTKNGREHFVPLSPQVVAILRALPKREPSEYVFGKYPDAPFSGFSKAKRELDEAIERPLGSDQGVRPWRIHDLRRTAASGMAALQVPPHIIEEVLNHTVSKLQRTYQIYHYSSEKRIALEKWADHVSSLVPKPALYLIA